MIGSRQRIQRRPASGEEFADVSFFAGGFSQREDDVLRLDPKLGHRGNPVDRGQGMIPVALHQAAIVRRQHQVAQVGGARVMAT